MKQMNSLYPFGEGNYTDLLCSIQNSEWNTLPKIIVFEVALLRHCPVLSVT